MSVWSGKIIAIHPLIKDNDLLGYAVVSRKNRMFYSPSINLKELLKDAKETISFNGFMIKDFKCKHHLKSLYYQLNPQLKFKSLEDIVKHECYCIHFDDVFYAIKPDGAENCVISANFMLEYYLKNYKKANKSILELDNLLLEKFSNRKSSILVDQFTIRTCLSIMQKSKWDLEREVFKEVGFPIWTCKGIKSEKIRDKLNEISSYKERITYVEKFLNISKVKIEFDTTSTSTGRILCRDKSNRIGLFAPDNRYREMFYCKESKVFISADYKRQEAFILAKVSKDKQLLKDIMDEDFYKNLGEEIMGDPSKQTGKTLFYAIVYGSSITTLAEEFNISETKAQAIMNNIKDRYRVLNNWISSFKEKTNYFGRPLYKSTVNAYIQSTAADIIRRKLIDTFDFNPVLVLADNIIYRIPKKDYKKSLIKIKSILDSTPFEGLCTEPIVSNSLDFRDSL